MLKCDAFLKVPCLAIQAPIKNIVPYQTKPSRLMFCVSCFREADFIVYFDKLDTLILDRNCLNEKTVFPRMTKSVFNPFSFQVLKLG